MTRGTRRVWLAASESSRLHRRADATIAGLALVVAVALMGWTAAYPLSADRLNRVGSAWLAGGARWPVVAVASAAGLAFLVLLVVGSYRLGRQDRRHVTWALAAALAACVVSAVLLRGWEAARGSGLRLGGFAGRPMAVVVDAALIAGAVASEVLRRGPRRRWGEATLLVLLIAGLADGTTRVIPLVLAVAGGSMAGHGVRFAVGASTIRPSPWELAEWMRARGTAVTGALMVGAAAPDALEGKLADGSVIDVRLADRDSSFTAMLSRAWSALRLRPPVAGHVPLTSRARLRELALACFLAEKAGVRAPEVLLMEPVEDRTMVVVTRRPAGWPLCEPLPPVTATALFAALRSLHRAGVAHRGLQAESLLAHGPEVAFASMDHAAPGASEISRRLDLAQLLSTVGRLSGAATAVAAMRSGYGPVDEAAVASVLQPLALAPWGWRAMRASAGGLAELRSELIGPGATVPPVPLERFRWRTVVSVGAMVLAAYVVAGQLSTVNLLSTLRRMSFGWFGVALAGSLITYVAAAANLEAFVPRRLALHRSFMVQMAAGFVGVAMPSTLGYVAVNARYLSREQVDQPSVAAAITLSQVSNAVTTVVTVAVLALLTGTGLSNVRLIPGTDLLLGAAAAAGLVALLALVPQTRVRLARYVIPHLRDLVPKLVDAVSHPVRLLVSVAASTLLNAGYVLAFVAALVAVGAHPPIVATIIVYLLGSFVGSAAPTPGGLGGVEAALAAGLATIGVPASEAIPAVVVFRFATFWLPIPAGWVAYVALQRSGAL